MTFFTSTIWLNRRSDT